MDEAGKWWVQSAAVEAAQGQVRAAVSKLDGLAAQGLGGREIAIAKTKLEEAGLWLGKVESELGHVPPE